MAAVCRCVNGHEFSSRVVAEEPYVDYFEVEDAVCPECHTTNFEVVNVEDEDWEDDDWERAE